MENLNITEKKVLKLLAEEYDTWGEGQCFYTRNIQASMKITFISARRAIRSLVSKGYAELIRGLIREEMSGYYGSGYCATQKGFDLAKELKLIEE